MFCANNNNVFKKSLLILEFIIFQGILPTKNMDMVSQYCMSSDFQINFLFLYLYS